VRFQRDSANASAGSGSGIQWKRCSLRVSGEGNAGLFGYLQGTQRDERLDPSRQPTFPATGLLIASAVAGVLLFGLLSCWCR
jgi:hypothetical protein